MTSTPVPQTMTITPAPPSTAELAARRFLASADPSATTIKETLTDYQVLIENSASLEPTTMSLCKAKALKALDIGLGQANTLEDANLLFTSMVNIKMASESERMAFIACVVKNPRTALKAFRTADTSLRRPLLRLLALGLSIQSVFADPPLSSNIQTVSHQARYLVSLEAGFSGMSALQQCEMQIRFDLALHNQCTLSEE